MPKLYKIAMIFVLIICFFALSSCTAGRDELAYSPEISNGADDENSESNDLSFDEPLFEGLTISLANIDPVLTRGRLDQSYWQRTSLCANQLNVIEGLYLSEVGMFLIDEPRIQSTASHSIWFRINNNTSNVLYYTFPPAPPNVYLEKNINGEWYEVPLTPGAVINIRRRSLQTVQMQLDRNETSRHRSLNLSYWFRLDEGLYRLVVGISFDSDSENRYYLSKEFEINMNDFKTRFSECQINPIDSIYLVLSEYNYEEGYILAVLNNRSGPSGYTITFGYGAEKEKYIDGIWYEVPINHISPTGESQGFVFSILNSLPASSTRTFEQPIMLRNWYPLTAGTYRLSMILSIDDGSPPYEQEFFPVSAVFKIVD